MAVIEENIGPEPSVNNRLYTLTKEKVAADKELFTAYGAITKKAEAGGIITANDFNRPEEVYNKKAQGFENRGYNLITSGAAGISEVLNRGKHYQKELENHTKEWQTNNPEILKEVANTKPLDEAFSRQYLTNATPKSLSLSASTDTPQELIRDLLKKNDGMVIAASSHSNETPSSFICDNIKILKKAGVDTIYIESDTASFLSLSNLSVAELRTKLSEREPEDVASDKKATAEHYGTKQADDKKAALIRLFAEAKENGIEIVNIDKKDPARSKEALESQEHRVASTNFTWTENIITDRKNKPDNGKYVVFGGSGHFISSMAGSKGLVDERLGIPVVAFDNRVKDEKQPILKGDSHNGADFYLPAGECYPDIKKLAKAADIDDFSHNKYLDSDGVRQLKELATRFRNEFNESTTLECKTSDNNTKIPTTISAPAQPAAPSTGASL